MSKRGSNFNAPPRRRPQAPARKSRGGNVHLIRAEAEIIVIGPAGEPLDTLVASMILSDLTPTGVTVFATNPLPLYERVSLRFESPAPFFAAGTVTSSQATPSPGHIVSAAASLHHRIHIQFKFESVEEKRIVREYCEEFTGKPFLDIA